MSLKRFLKLLIQLGQEQLRLLDNTPVQNIYVNINTFIQTYFDTDRPCLLAIKMALRMSMFVVHMSAEASNSFENSWPGHIRVKVYFETEATLWHF